MGTIRFELRTSKIDKEGNAPIRLIYQIGGQRKHYNTGQKTNPANWNGQQLTYIDKKTAKKLHPATPFESLLTAKEVEEKKGKLKELENQISNIEKRFEMDKIVYSIDDVIDKLKADKSPTTKKASPSKILYDFIDQYIAENSATRVPGSLVVYRSLKRHLQEYEKTSRKVSFDKIDYDFFQSFQKFLIEQIQTKIVDGKKVPKIVDGKKVPLMNNITIAKQLSTIKTFLNYAKVKGVKVSDEYKDFKIKKDPLEVIALTNEEFESLFYFDLSNNKRLSQVRDVFCFLCTTGLRHSDYIQLKREHIKIDEISLTIIKTKQELKIPLIEISKSILAKYQSMHRPLPVISNQKLNDYVKELCKLAGINEAVEIVRFRGAVRDAVTYPKYELIGTKTGRKTFATLSLEKGMSAEVVMAITGHKDYRSFQRYVKVTEKRKKMVMLKAWGGNISDVKLKAI